MKTIQHILFTSIFSAALVLGVLYGARDMIWRWMPAPLAVSPETIAETVPVMSVPAVVEAVNDAVVSVIATKDVPIYEQYYESYNPFSDWFGGFAIPRVRENGTEEQEVGGGSGFIVSADGLIVTNRHVVSDDAARYSVVLNDGSTHAVEVLAKDTVLDIAILQISTEVADLPHLRFGDSSSVKLGESVVAIGNALAEFRNSVSVGVISGLSRSIVARDTRGVSEQLSNVFQTDAAINPGNSGGPLLNLYGEVIGVNVAASVGAENIGFAIPSQAVEQIVTSVTTYGEIRRPYLGVRYITIDERVIEANSLPLTYGALIARGDTREELAVIPGSPADKAGLLENDVIRAVNGMSLETTDLATALRPLAIGDTVTLRVWSRGEERDVLLVLEAMPTTN